MMHALLELDCMPSGMELFPAANDSQWTLIKKVIEYSDYYILVLGGRYGSIGPEGISYTEMEYRHALSLNKPTIAFLHREPGKISADKTEATEEGKKKLTAFRNYVEKKMCKHWSSPQDLGSVVSRSLVQLTKSTPAIGWVRADEIADRDATLELLKLRKKVEELETQIARTRTTAPEGTQDLAQGTELHSVRYSFKSRDKDFKATKWTGSSNLSWNQLFATVAPLMIHECTEYPIRSAINALLGETAPEHLKKDTRLKEQTLSEFEIKEEDFQTLKIQMRALGLITKNEKPRSVKDTDTYWTLTPYGDQMMTRLRAIRRESQPATSVSLEKEKKGKK